MMRKRKRIYTDDVLHKIQEDYDSGLSWRKINQKYKISWATIQKYRNLGILKSRTMSEAIKLDNKLNPKTHTEETKNKISKSRKKYLKDNPDKVPYLLNHYSKKQPYSEKYFLEVIENECIDLKYHLQVGLYQLDFYNEEIKFYLEIDGEQHYTDQRIVESDQRRNKYFEKMGWVGMRVRWSNYKKLSLTEKKKVIQSIKYKIKELKG